MNACFIAYIVQAIINNFVPLLFLRFQEGYGIPLSKITLLVTVNFGIQLAVDLASAGFVDRIGYRASMLIAHICAAAGSRLPYCRRRFPTRLSACCSRLLSTPLAAVFWKFL